MSTTKYDVKTLYRFSLLVVGCPHQAEQAVKTALAAPNPLCRLWHELSVAAPRLGSDYSDCVALCGGSDRLCRLLCDLYWDERGLLLLRILLKATPDQIAEITQLPETRLFRLFSMMQARFDALRTAAIA